MEKEVATLEKGAACCGWNYCGQRLAVGYADGSISIHDSGEPAAASASFSRSSKWTAEFQNVIDSVSRFGRPSCMSASIAWNSRRGESQQSSFVLGFSSDLPQFNSSKVWEFDEAHQRWLPVAELALPGDKADRVHAVAWAPNIGRPYEVVAVATSKGIAIWHVGLDLDSDGRLSTEKIALLSGHHGEVWQLEWDMSGMTLASTGADGMVKLWQSNLNGVWHEQATLECNSLQ